MNNTLIGIWKLDVADIQSGAPYDNISLEFKEDGRLEYAIYENDRKQAMLLTYEIDGGFIITDQPSHPQKERTGYSFLSDGRLELVFEGRATRYIKL